VRLRTDVILGAALGAHLVLGIAMANSAAVARAHSLTAIAAGFLLAAFDRNADRVAYAACYVGGVEVAWRMAGGGLSWEIGKLAMGAFLLIALVRLFRGWRLMGLPLLYMALLLPASLLTIQAMGLAEGREHISFNLSGPIALGIGVLFFSQLRARLRDVRRLAWMAVTPIVSVAAIAWYGTVTAGDIDFTTQSNFATSGGFGPNQVSAVLGLGVLFCVMLAITERRMFPRVAAIGLAIAFASQAVLTFSRGGIYNTGAALLLASFFYLRDPRSRFGAIVTFFVIGLVALYVLVPRLDAFTDGVLSDRYATTDLTNRVEIVQADIDVWRDNPIAGVGPGMARQERGGGHVLSGNAHTEYSRALAEHGIAGLVALVVLALIVLRSFVRARSPLQKAWVVSLTTWGLIEMTHSATRISAIALVFGLAALEWIDDDEEDPSESEDSGKGRHFTTSDRAPALGAS
jgi:O-antigen ligase